MSPESLRTELLSPALISVLMLVSALIVRETQRASVRATAVRLLKRQFPTCTGPPRTSEDFARRLGLRRRSDIFLNSDNGALNAFAAQGIDLAQLWMSHLFTIHRPERSDRIGLVSAGVQAAKTPVRPETSPAPSLAASEGTTRWPSRLMSDSTRRWSARVSATA